MDKEKFSYLKLLLFLFGYVLIIIISACLSKPLGLSLGRSLFAALMLILMYTSVFFPLLVANLKGDVAKIAASASVYYKGMAAYIVASAGELAALVYGAPLGMIIASQCVAVFLFLLYIFLSIFTAKHIENVQTSEVQKKYMIKELKERAAELVALSSNSDQDVQKAVRKLEENVRFLSPVSSQAAIDLECMMCDKLDRMLYAIDSAANGDNSTDLMRMLNEFDVLYRQRKSKM